MEIGSEFWLSQDSKISEQKFFPTWLNSSLDTRFLLSGKTALDYILSDIEIQGKIKCAYVPASCCQSILIPFLLRGIKIKFYDIHYDVESGILYDIDGDVDCDVFLYMQYFGFAREQSEELSFLKSRG